MALAQQKEPETVQAHGFCACGAKPYTECDGRVEHTYREHKGVLQKCDGCAYTFFSPAPDGVALDEFYNSVYSAQQLGWYNVDAAYAPEAYVDTINTVKTLAAKHFTSDFSKVVTHDVGCSYGGLVHQLHHAGFEATGTELNRDAVEQGRARGNTQIHPIDCESFFKTYGKKAHIITFNHSLEHFTDPRVPLRWISNCLADDGYIVIKVPNGMYYPALALSMHEFSWVEYPAHLHNFTPTSISCLLASVGLHLYSVRATPREEDAGLLQAALFGRARMELPNYDALLDAVAKNYLTREIEFVACKIKPPHHADVAAQVARAKTFEQTLSKLSSPLPLSSAQNFSGQQGKDGWSYGYKLSANAPVERMSLYNQTHNIWVAPGEACAIGVNFMHPSHVSPVRIWKAPQAGLVKARFYSRLRYGAVEGLSFALYKNGKLLSRENINADAPLNYEGFVRVAAGDEVQFAVTLDSAPRAEARTFCYMACDYVQEMG